MYKPDVCIYHANCADGFTAAWVVWSRFGDDVTYVPASYGDTPPYVGDKRVLVVDFSYPREVLTRMALTARSIVVLDHHRTAQQDLASFAVTPCGGARFSANDVQGMLADLVELHSPTVLAEFDMDRSGAQMAWDFYYPKQARPRLVDYVADRDLWRHAMPFTREVNAVVSSYGQGFSTWDCLYRRVNEQFNDDGFLSDGWGRVRPSVLLAEGQAILRIHDRQLASLLATCTREMVIGGVRVPVVNLPYHMASDGAGRLAERAPFAASYQDAARGWVFSLRSRGKGGADVSEVARRYGGGGHRNAAGFSVPHGWSGDVA